MKTTWCSLNSPTTMIGIITLIWHHLRFYVDANLTHISIGMKWVKGLWKDWSLCKTMIEKLVLVREKIKATQDQHGSWARLEARLLEFKPMTKSAWGSRLWKVWHLLTRTKSWVWGMRAIQSFIKSWELGISTGTTASNVQDYNIFHVSQF